MSEKRLFELYQDILQSWKSGLDRKVTRHTSHSRQIQSHTEELKSRYISRTFDPIRGSHVELLGSEFQNGSTILAFLTLKSVTEIHHNPRKWRCVDTLPHLVNPRKWAYCDTTYYACNARWDERFNATRIRWLSSICNHLNWCFQGRSAQSRQSTRHTIDVPGSQEYPPRW